MMLKEVPDMGDCVGDEGGLLTDRGSEGSN